VRQADDVLFTSRPVQLAPSRAVPIDDSWLGRVDPGGAPVTIALAR
jgi:hypothetical protein